MSKRLISCAAAIIMIIALLPIGAMADENKDGSIYHIGSVVNTGTDTGYSDSNPIQENDPHFGWRLGDFTVTGFTSVVEGKNDMPVFLKTAGDKVKLSFKLDQNLDALNGNEALSINDDGNGYDQYFEVAKQDFGRGTLIVRQTNYQNETGEPQVYVSYLEGKEQGADTEIELFEEGDYEVSLDYEIKDDPRRVGPVSIVPSYSNYKISFKFAVRNGNCMIFPFDLKTKSELANESYAPDGFYLDLARSRYLSINVKKEVMAPGANGLVEDTRFNGPACDGDQYTEDGIYTVTAKNDYTGQETAKKIYVGDDPVLKCFAVTGIPITEINQRIANGEVVSKDGQLITPGQAEEEERQEEGGVAGIIITIVAACVIAGIAVATAHRKKRASEAKSLPQGTENQELTIVGKDEDDR